MRRRAAWAVTWTVVLGCGGGDGTPVDGGETDAGATGGAFALFEPTAAGATPFLNVPFPSDLYLGADGHVDIGEMPGYPDYVANARIELSTRTAFCRICAVTFPVRGDIDPATVPGDAAPDGVASSSDAMILVRADGTGGPIPLQIDYHDVGDVLVMRPRYGIVLEPGTRYVAAVTDTIHATDGSALAPWPVFAALRDGGELDAAGERARPMVDEALAALETAGVERSRIVATTAFTTEGDVRLLREVADIAADAAVPTIAIERVWTEAELPGLFGQPSEDRPGIDIPPSDGVGTGSIVHDAMAFVITGTFTSPRVVSGTGTEIGLPLRDDAGALAPGATHEQIPWVLMVPKDVDLASVPVVLVHHGNPAHKITALQIGNTFARMGMAVFGYDAFQMGGRAASAKDEHNELRGIDDAPDGLAEHVGTAVAVRLVGLDGAAPGNEDRPDHAVGFGVQLSLDVLMALRALGESDWAPVRGANAALAGLSFDAGQIYFVGQSFGGYTGMTVLPLLAGRVQAAVLMVGPPDFTENLCNSPKNRAMAETLLTPIFGLRGPFETTGRRLCMTPTFDLARWLLEPFSPVSSLHFALVAPIEDGSPPDLLFYYADYDELLGNASGEHVLGVAGVPVRGETHFTSLPALEAPLSGNLTTPAGSITAAGWIWSSDHSLIRTKHTTVAYQSPFYPPFTALAEPRPHVNPIEDAHRQIAHFIETRRTGGRAEVADPSSL